MGNRRIEIIEGKDPSSYFIFCACRIEYTNPTRITWEDMPSQGDVFSIEEGDVDCFLKYFLLKYFDNELPYNKYRVEWKSGDDVGYVDGFEWWVEPNYFLYDTIEKMCKEIVHKMDLLKFDFHNQELDGLKKRFSIYYMCDKNDADYKNGDNSDDALLRHVDVVIDFYDRFVRRIRHLMRSNKNAEVVSVSGP